MMSTDSTTLTAHQLLQGICWPQDGEVSAIAPALPPAVQTKIDALGHVLQTLRAADSGWPADQPQTPETLLPYVTDEVEELLEALHAAAPVAVEPAPPVPTPQPIADLSTTWLWAIAASLPTAMQLLEGVAASSRDQPAAYGVRLVPLLKLQPAGLDYTLDLATQVLLPHLQEFAPTALIQLLDEPTAPIATAAALTRQIREQSIALAPALRSWYEGIKVHLCLPGMPWGTAQARLELQLVPLTVQAAPSLAAIGATADHAEARGLPTVRVWQAAPLSAPVTTDTPASSAPTDAPMGSLDAELSFTDIPRFEPALQATHRLDIHQLVNDRWRAHPELTSGALLETVMEAITATEAGGLTIAQSPIALAALCTQVKWLWIRASPTQVALMGGLPARRLRSGQGWQAGTVKSQGQLIFHTPDRPLTRLDVATKAWTIAAPHLQPDDLLQITAGAADLPIVGQVNQLTQAVNQTVRSRSPLLASLMAGHPVQLWSPQDVLFPEVTPPARHLQFQVGLTFFPSLL